MSNDLVRSIITDADIALKKVSTGIATATDAGFLRNLIVGILQDAGLPHEAEFLDSTRYEEDKQ